MQLIRIAHKKIGVKYLTSDVKFRIWKPYKKACWELAEITGNGHKIIKYYKYFNDARKHLKSIYGGPANVENI